MKNTGRVWLGIGLLVLVLWLWGIVWPSNNEGGGLVRTSTGRQISSGACPLGMRHGHGRSNACRMVDNNAAPFGNDICWAGGADEHRATTGMLPFVLGARISSPPIHTKRTTLRQRGLELAERFTDKIPWALATSPYPHSWCGIPAELQRAEAYVAIMEPVVDGTTTKEEERPRNDVKGTATPKQTPDSLSRLMNYSHPVGAPIYLPLGDMGTAAPRRRPLHQPSSSTAASGSDGEPNVNHEPVPWLDGNFEALGLNGPYASFAQRVIYDSQAQGDARGSTCRDRNLILFTMSNYGIGADVTLFTIALLHAIQLNRSLVVYPPVWRWAVPEICADDSLDPRFHQGTNSRGNGTGAAAAATTAGWRGRARGSGQYPLGRTWDCYFAPPSPCTVHDLGDPAEWKRLQKGTNAQHMNHVRVLQKHGLVTQDLHHRPEVEALLPSGVTAAMVEKRTGLSFAKWCYVHALRYLMRSTQPWFGHMVRQHLLREMKRVGPRSNAASRRASTDAGVGAKARVGAGKPVPAAILGMHFRNGDTKKKKEVFAQYGCAQFDEGLPFAAASAMVNLTGASTVLATFDDVSVVKRLEHALRTTFHQGRGGGAGGGNNLTTPQVTVTSTDFPYVAQNDARVMNRSDRAVVADSRPARSGNVFADPGQRDLRDDVVATHGFPFLVRMSFVNLYAATALPDVWANDDSSSWSRLIEALRLTGGKFYNVYLDYGATPLREALCVERTYTRS